MTRSTALRRIVALLLCGALVLAACGDDDAGSDDSADPAATDTGSDDGATPDDEAPDDSADGAETGEAIDDLCALMDTAAVEAALGEPNVVAETTPSGGCGYTSDERGLYPTIEATPDLPDNGGLAGAQSGAEASLGATAETIDVDGVPGYFVTGELSGFTSTQAAVVENGYLIIVTMSGSESAGRQDVATALLALAVTATA